MCWNAEVTNVRKFRYLEVFESEKDLSAYTKMLRAQQTVVVLWAEHIACNIPVT